MYFNLSQLLKQAQDKYGIFAKSISINPESLNSPLAAYLLVLNLSEVKYINSLNLRINELP